MTPEGLPPAPLDDELRVPLHIGLSLLLHVVFLTASAMAIPALGEVSADDPPEETQYMIAQAFADPAEPEEEAGPVEVTDDPEPDGRAPVLTRCGDFHGGSMGKPAAEDRALRYGVQGSADNPDPHIANAVGFSVAWDMIGNPMPGASWNRDADAPTALWGREDALGNDPRSARGHLWGEDFGETYGSPGTGLGRHDRCETCGDTGTGAPADPAPPPGEEDDPLAGCLGLLRITD